jgi:hypothetical protein
MFGMICFGVDSKTHTLHCVRWGVGGRKRTVITQEEMDPRAEFRPKTEAENGRGNRPHHRFAQSCTNVHTRAIINLKWTHAKAGCDYASVNGP